MSRKRIKAKRVLFASVWWHNELMHAVTKKAAQRGWHLNMESLLSGKINANWSGDGIVCIPAAPSRDLAKLLSSGRCPAVALSLAESKLNIPRVGIDNEVIGRMAADHFLERGFRSFALVSAGDLNITKQIQRSFETQIQECACSYQHISLNPGSKRKRTWEDRQRFLAHKLQSLPKPAGIFVTGDHYAVEVIEACLRSSLEIPDEIAILGCLNMDLFRDCTTVSLSSIVVDFDLHVDIAFDLLDRMMEGEAPPNEPILIPPIGIYTRKSTDTLATQSPQLTKAIRFMFDHYSNDIRIADIAKEAGLSRRVLFLAFDREFGQPPGAVLTRIRLDKAKRMLLDTDAKVSAVSEACGFGDSINMFRHFKREIGMSAAAYKKAKGGTSR